MNWNTPTALIGGLLVLLMASRAIWTMRTFDSHRLARFVGWPVDEDGRLSRFYFWEGTFSSEVDRAMSAEYAAKYRWLLSSRSQRLVVVLNVVSWMLCLFGALDLSWNLGFGDSFGSWWFALTIAAYLLLRASVRVVADAPDELLDERLVALRHRAYLIAYRWLALLLFLVFGFMVGLAEGAAPNLPLEEGLAGDALLFGAITLMFVAASLPSMVLAWSGSVKEQ